MKNALKRQLQGKLEQECIKAVDGLTGLVTHRHSKSLNVINRRQK